MLYIFDRITAVRYKSSNKFAGYVARCDLLIFYTALMIAAPSISKTMWIKRTFSWQTKMLALNKMILLNYWLRQFRLQNILRSIFKGPTNIFPFPNIVHVTSLYTNKMWNDYLLGTAKNSRVQHITIMQFNSLKGKM